MDRVGFEIRGKESARPVVGHNGVVKGFESGEEFGVLREEIAKALKLFERLPRFFGELLGRFVDELLRVGAQRVERKSLALILSSANSSCAI